MKRRLLTTVILILSVCLLLSACDAVGTLGDNELPNHQEVNTVVIYVCGAVEHEGYYEVEVGMDYYELLRKVGLLPVSAPPTFSSAFVDGSVTDIVVDYFDGGVRRYSINVNNPWIASRSYDDVEGLTREVVDRLADYIEAHGSIANKEQLKLALLDDYDDNYYKLFIAETDYEID